MDFDEIIDHRSACQIDLDFAGFQTIKVKILMDYIYIYKKNKMTKEFDKCVTNQIRDPHFHYMSIAAANH